ncbi:MAG: hypothetical protein J6X47_09060 [Clostridia bacterium]|nr:hypothetical protein [Clostridia bacterium]
MIFFVKRYFRLARLFGKSTFPAGNSCPLPENPHFPGKHPETNGKSTFPTEIKTASHKRKNPPLPAKKEKTDFKKSQIEFVPAALKAATPQ